MRFDKYPLHPKLKSNLASNGFHKTTDIQYKAIYGILSGKDILAIAQTGTGKTAAFAIPIIHMAISKKVKSLVVVPTHELALQIEKVFLTLSKGLAVRCKAIFGGVEQKNQETALAKGVDILIATPGRLFDLQHQRILNLREIDLLVVDEADHMLSLGFLKDILDLVERMSKKRQTLFFSATINPEVKKLANKLVSQAVRIEISPDNPVNKNINHFYARIELDHKRHFLGAFLEENKGAKIICFVRTKVRAGRVLAHLNKLGFSALEMHGGLDQKERNQVMGAFGNNEITCLIATDVSARGIDFPDIDVVINYDLPDEPENYVHRIGRTGRGRNKGKAFSFVANEEEQKLQQIENYLGRSIEEIVLDPSRYEETILLHEKTQGMTLKDIQKEIAKLDLKKKKK